MWLQKRDKFLQVAQSKTPSKFTHTKHIWLEHQCVATTVHVKSKKLESEHDWEGLQHLTPRGSWIQATV